MTLMTETFDGKVIVSVDSTADCVNAIQICGSEDISVDKTKGPGFDEMEGCSPSGQEFQSRWYRFDVLESGDFEFMVDNPSTSFGDLGGAPTNFSPTLAVTAGETYFLMIDNASSNGIGFDLSFAGSAIIGDETLRAIIAANCCSEYFKLHQPKYSIGCNSIYSRQSIYT